MYSRVDYFKHGVCVLPVIMVTYLRHYYGYPVLGITLAWIKWQWVLKIGARKVQEERKD